MVQSLVPDKNGQLCDVVLGYDYLEKAILLQVKKSTIQYTAVVFFT